VAGVLGLAVGSFLNVVVYRVPRHESVVRPRSRCPSCGSPIAERDNIPVLSWVLLRGRCRHCDNPISVRYPLVEAGTAVIWVVLAVVVGPSVFLAPVLVLAAGLFAGVLVAAEHRRVPGPLVIGTLAGALAALAISAAANAYWSHAIH